MTTLNTPDDAGYSAKAVNLAQRLEDLADDESLPPKIREQLLTYAKELRSLADSKDFELVKNNLVSAFSLIASIAKLISGL